MEQPKPKFEFRNRSQVYLGPVDIEALIEAGHPARAVWALLESLDFSGFEDQILSREGQAGRAAVPPRLLAALWIYGYSLGVGSARALERMQAHEPGLRWLCADQAVNHHTLSDFRVRHEQALDALFTQVLATMEQGGLLDLNTVVQDGTKVQAASSSASYHRRRGGVESLIEARRVVKQLKAQAEADPADERRAAAQQRAARERLERMRASLRELRRRRRATEPAQRAELRVSDSEPDARKMKMAAGHFASAYNLQLSAETQSNAIVAVEVTQAPADMGQLPGAVEQVERRLGRRPERWLADGGYASRDNVEYAAGQKIELYAPWKEDAERHKGALLHNGIAEEFGPQAFVHEPEADELICPAGERLMRQGTRRKHGLLKVVYEAPAAVCGGCAERDRCCGKAAQERGRRVDRVLESAAMQAYYERMASEEGRQIYKKRSQYGEFPQMQIKGVRGLRRFHVRGLKKAKQEGMWWALAYNVGRWIRLGWANWKTTRNPAPAAC